MALSMTSAALETCTADAIESPASRSRNRRAPGGVAFTLVEMLVVIGILTILAGLLLPMIAKARHQAQIAAQQLDFNAISTALNAYRHDFGGYPVNFNTTGVDATLVTPPGLADALLGPGNTGFQTLVGPDGKNKGSTFGPYLQPDKFTTITTGSVGGIGRQLADRWGGPILFYVVRAPLTAAAGQLGALGPITIKAADSQGRFSKNDSMLENPNLVPIDSSSNTFANWAPIRVALGDADNSNLIEPAKGEKLTFDGPFILVSGGIDPPPVKFYGSASTYYWGFDSWGTANISAGTLITGATNESLVTPYTAGQADPGIAIPTVAREAVRTGHNIYNFDPFP